MGGMAPDSFYNSQLFSFLFAAVIFVGGVVLMNVVLMPALARMKELDQRD